VRRQLRLTRRSETRVRAPSPQQILGRSTNLLLRGAYREALQILRAAIRRHSDNAPILARYGDALYQTGKIDAARNAYIRALALDESIFQAWYGQGMAQYSFEAYAASIRCFRQALVLRPRDLAVRFHLANALFEMGEVDNAIDELLVVGRNARWRRALRKIAIFIVFARFAPVLVTIW